MIKGTLKRRSVVLALTDYSVMSGIITGPHFRKYFNQPDAIQLGTMVAVLEVGAFSTSPTTSPTRPSSWFSVTSLAAGRVGDIIGRRGTLFTGALVFTIGGAIQTGTTGYEVMIVGRVISGFGVGLLSCVHTPPHSRPGAHVVVQHHRSNLPK